MKSSIFALIVLVALGAPIGAIFAAPAQVAMTSQTSDASLKEGRTQTVSWATSNFPQNASVNINLIKKVSDSPRKYTLVRQIALNSANDGRESWKVANTDIGESLYVEVTCGTSGTFNEGCRASISQGKLAVVKSNTLDNLANTFLSIFGLGE